jgi:hypothetical protein
MNKFFLFSLVSFCFLYGNNLTLIGKVGMVSKDSLKVKSLMQITQRDLTLYSKNDNIQTLFSKALNENRINYSAMKYMSSYKNFENGDILLLKCLKREGCDVAKFANIMNKSELHQKIAYRFPDVNIGKLNQLVGSINENLMNRYFLSSGWTKIEGEVGRNGIDGLFIKRTKDGSVKDVLIVESKYNKSGLQDTENGMQMTKQWIIKKIDNLKKKFPDNNDYNQIAKFVENDTYRSMLWNLKVENQKLIFDLSKITDKFENIEKTKLVGGEKFKINQSNNSFIDMNNPSNEFQQKVVTWYKQEMKMLNL